MGRLINRFFCCFITMPNRIYIKFILLLLTAGIFAACAGNDPKAPKEVKPYDGPILEADNIESLFSDSAVVRVSLKAPKEYKYTSGDLEFPEGLNMIFINATGDTTATLRGDQGNYTRKDNLYKVWGDVHLVSFESNEELTTEELFWNPKEETIYTDKFVNIRTDTEILQGEGLTAAQDFSTYKILKITGEFSLEE